MKCPKCESLSVTSTMMGCIGLDMNTVYCGVCNNKGVAWRWQSGEEVSRDLRSLLDRGMIKLNDIPEIIQWGMNWLALHEALDHREEAIRSPIITNA